MCAIRRENKPFCSHIKPPETEDLFIHTHTHTHTHPYVASGNGVFAVSQEKQFGAHRWEDELWWKDLLKLWQTQMTFPASASSSCGRSPALSLSSPEERPGSRNSVLLF